MSCLPYDAEDRQECLYHKGADLKVGFYKGERRGTIYRALTEK